MPRTIALGKVEQVAMAVAYPLVFFHYLLYPLVVLFNRIAHAVLCLLGVDPVPDEDISRSEDELRMIVSASERGGKLDHMESRLIDNVLFCRPCAREVMVPCQDMFVLYTVIHCRKICRLCVKAGIHVILYVWKIKIMFWALSMCAI